MSIVYLNGDYLPLEEARISVLDRGFTFADAVYEVIPVYSGTIFRLQEHLQRLQNSLSSIEISNPLEDAQWESIFNKVLEQNPCEGDRSLYVQVSRGASDPDHLNDRDLQPTVFIMSREFQHRDWTEGVNVITHRDIRWEYCHIKSTALLANVMLKQLARAAEAKETILTRDGMITEGARSNVFIVYQGAVITTEKDGNILAGITRDLVVELLNHAGIDCKEKRVSTEEFDIAEEIWISSSTMGLAPVVKVNDRVVGNGKPGPIWKKANDLFRDFRENRITL